MGSAAATEVQLALACALAAPVVPARIVSEEWQCHCGIYNMDGAVFKEAGESAASLERWVKQQHPEAACHYLTESGVVGGAKLLHVNFVSEAALVAAMASSTHVERSSRLRRCLYKGSATCGLAKEKHPELVRLKVRVPVGAIKSRAAGAAAGAASSGCASWAEEVCTGIESALGRKVLIDSVSVLVGLGTERLAYARFHALDGVHALVHREEQLRLWGQPVVVEAPNVPRLALCHGCKGRGHVSQYCTRFHGIVIRTLYSVPVPESKRALIQQAAGAASSVYTGLFPAIKRPNRLVHCVYPDMASMVAGVQSMREQLSGLWLQPPVQAHAAQRSSECSECGDSSHRGFACPLLHGQHAMSGARAVGVGALKSFAAAVGGSSSACALAASAALPSSSAAVAAKSKPAASGAPKAHAHSSRRAVCFQWRDTSHSRSVPSASSSTRVRISPARLLLLR